MSTRTIVIVLSAVALLLAFAVSMRDEDGVIRRLGLAIHGR